MSILHWKLFAYIPLIFTTVTHIQSNPDFLKETNLSSVEMISRYGYAAEIYQVLTLDGYYLELHRIIKNRKGETFTRHLPVLIPNIFLGSSAEWVLAGPTRSLALQLSDDGYDVWLSNFRGTTYSRRHLWLKDTEFDYWNFSLHELAVQDLPAIIDYILNKTKTTQLHFIGFSLGTTIFYVFGAEKPEYLKKIRVSISLAPTTNMYNSTSSLKWFGSNIKKITYVSNLLAKGKFLTHSRLLEQFLLGICKLYITHSLICMKMIVYSAFGTDPVYFDEELIPLLLGHYPAGTSAKLIEHYNQFISTESFGQYDYGPELNMEYYKSETPPEYDLKSINVPVYLFTAKNDILANPTDVKKLRLKLPFVVKEFHVDNDYFNHSGFIFAKNVNEVVNVPVMNILHEADLETWNPVAMKK